MKRVAVAMLAVLAMAGGAMAETLDPRGTWESASGESRYEVSLCGDGTALCARLVWLRENEMTPKNIPYLGSYLVEAARRVGPSEWRGEVQVFGETLGGTLRQISTDRMELRGCKFIFCKSFMLNRM
ncbi:DUF2147 domain-containing protein [Arsenicitalea aurantiaca]|uniref:DUF2147 domain-containing protein n=1 Tax=Arsenicitalea aurantiaca TaxID=1783274 RepID=A0A433XLN1_9HYPH|nr:DUF2147 domain-containing protein [Arsenicitalea aurantiaca]RUT34992.1 DUF2147 domain-containing protein [Arsenicitalea aurantiaca]